MVKSHFLHKWLHTWKFILRFSCHFIWYHTWHIPDKPITLNQAQNHSIKKFCACHFFWQYLRSGIYFMKCFTWSKYDSYTMWDRFSPQGNLQNAYMIRIKPKILYIITFKNRKWEIKEKFTRELRLKGLHKHSNPNGQVC